MGSKPLKILDLKKENTNPPRLPLCFFRWFCHPKLRDHIEGDLMELYEERVKEFGKRNADRKFIGDVLLLFRPGIIGKNRFSHSLNPFDMFMHNMLLSFRGFMRYKISFLINLIGLSSGLTASLLIYLWVNDELRFDKFHEKDQQLYQVMERRVVGGNTFISDESTGLIAEEIKAQMPEVEYAASLAPSSWFQKFTLSIGEHNVKAVGQYVGPEYLNIFSFPLIEGDKGKVLADKSSIVITRALAIRLFGTVENVIGKIVEFQHERQFIISGILEDVPFHSSEQFEFLLSFELFKDLQPWVKVCTSSGPHNFLILKEGTNIEQFNAKIANMITDNCEHKYRTAYVFPFSDNYLNNSFDHGARTGGRIEYVRLFSVIAVFILLIACINFMNLSTARATRRIKEIGIKKAIGVLRKQLIVQYLTESMLLTILSSALALLMVFLLLPWFNVLTGKQIQLEFDYVVILSILGIITITGLIAGSYPALYLSGFDPATVLKGKLNTSLGEVWARKGLVIFQFAISIVLIVSVTVVYQQIQYIQNKNLGYDRDNVILFDSEGKVLNAQQTFIDEVKRVPGVVNASGALHNIVGRIFAIPDLSWPGKNENEVIFFEGVRGGYDLLQTMGMQIVAGRNYIPGQPADVDIIINETAAKTMGMGDPVGKTMILQGKEVRIIGVMKDFFFQSMHTAMQPVFYQIETESPNSWHRIIVKLAEGEEKETIARLEKLYREYNPGFTLEYQYMDDAYQKMYASEARVGILSQYFAGIAILISCLGLFGLTAFTAERRQKEIGIRKVLGSSHWNIIYLLSLDFTKMVVLSIVIALPISYFMTSNWLHGFVYRINLEWWYFIGAALTALIVAWLTVGIQTVKAAQMNPVKSLKSE